jgi:hypothetical protein
MRTAAPERAPKLGSEWLHEFLASTPAVCDYLKEMLCGRRRELLPNGGDIGSGIK